MTDVRMKYEDRRALVFKVAQELLDANGKEPTLELVKEKVGGSYSTLTKCLREWRADTQRGQSSPVEEAPEAVMEMAQRLAGQIWLVSQQETADQVRAIKEAATVECKQLKEELAEVIKSADMHEARAAELAEELQAARLDKSEAETKVQVLEARIADLTDRNEELKRELAQQNIGGAMDTLSTEIRNLTPLLAKLNQLPANSKSEPGG